jgi:DNA repair protein RadB
MPKISSGSQLIDEFLEGGYEDEVITTVFGPAGSGKTTFALLAALSVASGGKRVIYMDTEGGFSTERFQQLTQDHEKMLEKIVFLQPTSFEKQKEAFDKLRSLASKDIGLIIIDSIAMLYRMELGKSEEIYEINRDLGRQIGFLTEIARTKKIPVLITNQAYSMFGEREKMQMVGGDILKYGSKCVLELQITPTKLRRLVLVKHRSMKENKQTLFEITSTGIGQLKPQKSGFKIF